MLDLHGISRESFDLIVDEEVSGRAVYEKKYVRPEKPGGASGVTIGIGYDCGYSSAATIRKDWAGKIHDDMIEALATQAAGKTGDEALAPCAHLRDLVSVPWDAAIDVFSNVSIPKYMSATRKGLPGYDALTPDCKGALLSLVYNRGASFQKAGDRYREMRGVRAAMVSGNLTAIPDLLRSMARLWTAKSVRGVALRREHEARLFERGLASVAQAPATDSVPDTDRDDADETAGTAPFPTPPVVPPAAPVAIKRNFLLTAWAAVSTFVAGIYNSVSDYVSQAWDFFTDHKDDIPTDPGLLHTAWGYVSGVPTTVWILIAAAGLGLLAISARSGLKTINESVETGAEQ